MKRASKKVRIVRTASKGMLSRRAPTKLPGYAALLTLVKHRIRESQVRASFSVNAELILLYWDIGRILDEQHQRQGYGAAVIPRLAQDLRHQFPDLTGFSVRNIGRMMAFFRAYSQ